MLEDREVLWLLISGVIHLWFEGTFVFFRHHEFYLKMDIYMVADWCYGNPMEPGTRAMEAITSVMEGPLCLLVAYAAVKNKIWRHPAQLIVTTCQIYGLYGSLCTQCLIVAYNIYLQIHFYFSLLHLD